MAEVAVRRCSIKAPDQADPLPLEIVFHSPTPTGEEEFGAEAVLSCAYFEKRLTCRGLDGVQAFLGLFLVVHGFLKGREDQGFSIYHFEPGDLDDPGFWGMRRLTLEP